MVDRESFMLVGVMNIESPRAAMVRCCNRHPDEQFSGFCPSCLRERLARLGPAPERRRSTRSLSRSKNDDSCIIQPPRTSCDVSHPRFTQNNTGPGDVDKSETVGNDGVEIIRPVIRGSYSRNVGAVDGDEIVKKSFGGGFRAAASAFQKKWHDWRRNLNMTKKQSHSHVDYGFGTRSCDTDSCRLSIDAVGRISCDAEVPRASWDGYLIGRGTCLRMQPPPMVSGGIDDNDGHVPGGSVQTKEYYLYSSSRRKKLIADQSNFIRKAAEINEAAHSVTGIEQSKSRWGGLNMNVVQQGGTSTNHGMGLFAGKEVNGNYGKKRINDDKRRNHVNFSPNYMDNGLLRFYLTPRMRSRRKPKTKNPWMY